MINGKCCIQICELISLTLEESCVLPDESDETVEGVERAGDGEGEAEIYQL